MNHRINPGDLLPFLNTVSKQAGDTLRSYFRGQFSVDRKNPGEKSIDIVTDADRASEEIILEAIRKEFPDHDILAEETLTEKTGSPWMWLVDPLDGTINFAHGIPFFAVSIALMEHGTVIGGMIHDPVHEESFWAFRGHGAFLNGDPIQVSTSDRLNRSIVATGFPYDRATSSNNNVAEFSRVVTRVQGIRRGGSAAMDLAYVSCGRIDGFWELKLNPWDMGAGMLLVEEAGGRTSDEIGKPTDPYTKYIVASNSLIHDLLLELLTVKE